MKLCDLSSYLEDLLNIVNFSQDFCVNGIQCEGKPEVNKIAFAVDASLRTIQGARREKADMLLVHHGLIWGSGLKQLVGYEASRFRELFTGNISLFAVHLPLDAHPVFGNNAAICNILKLKKRQPAFAYKNNFLGFSGSFSQPKTLTKICDILSCSLPVAKIHIIKNPQLPEEKISTVGVISGHADLQSIIDAKQLGLDAVITGEVTHSEINAIWELEIPVITAGHYATEVGGVRALQQHLQNKFPSLQTVFIPAPTAF